MPSIEPKNVAPIMFGLMLSLFLANLDQTIVATCLPAIARDLNGWEILPWVISSYLVTSTATTPIYGRLSDLYGRRPVLLTSIALFVLASAFCALAYTMPLLIVARTLQGIGGGGLRSITQVVIADIIPPRNRGRYQGYMSTTFLLSTTLGPVLGGFFADHLSWQWAFWINLPLGALAFYVIDRQLRRLVLPTRASTIDWLGAALILAAATPLMIGISRVELEGGWVHWSVLAPILIGAVATAALVRQELRVAEPMIPMRLFANRVFTIGNLALFLPSMVLTALIIIVPLYYQTVLRWSADDAGLQLIALTGGMAAGSFVAGSAVSRIGRARMFPVAGGVVAGICCLLIAAYGLGRSTAFDVICTFVLGAALGSQINPMLVIVQNGLDVRDIGPGVSGMTFFRSLGGAFGVATLTTFLIGRLAVGASLTPGHERIEGELGAALLRPSLGPGFSAEQLAAFDAVRQHAFAATFVFAGILTAVGGVAMLLIKERPLRATSGRQGR